jgi:hypothetical protein
MTTVTWNGAHELSFERENSVFSIPAETRASGGGARSDIDLPGEKKSTLSE